MAQVMGTRVARIQNEGSLVSPLPCNPGRGSSWPLSGLAKPDPTLCRWGSGDGAGALGGCLTPAGLGFSAGWRGALVIRAGGGLEPPTPVQRGPWTGRGEGGVTGH